MRSFPSCDGENPENATIEEASEVLTSCGAFGWLPELERPRS